MLVAISLVLLVLQDTAGNSEALELQDAYRRAEQHNQRIVAARALADAVQSRAASARRPPDPQVQLGAMNYALPRLRAMDAVGMSQLQVMQMLPAAGKLRLAGRVADLSADADAERADAVRWDIRVRVAMVFYDLYAADRSLAIDRETLRLLQDVLHVSEAMYRVGDGRQADVLRAQVEIARMTQDTIRMSAMREVMTARLSALLNGGAVAGSPVLPAFPDSTPSLESLVATASRHRPMLRAAQRDADAADARVSLARRDLWPDLAIGVQYGQRTGMEGTDRMASVMIGATVPIFARSRQLRMRDETAAMERMARADVDAMRAETAGAVAEVRANLVRARTLARSYRSTLLPQADGAAESALASYRAGRIDFMTLLDSRMSVNRYRKELVVLEAEEGEAWSELEMLAGRELFASRAAVGSVGRRIE